MLTHREDWLPIAEQASKEADPEKLMMLVEQLCSALDDRKKPALPPNRNHVDHGSKSNGHLEISRR